MSEQQTQRLHGFVDDQRAYFDTLITRDWETYHDPLWDASREFEIRRLFEHVSPGTVLDVGCGCGFHDVLIAEQPGVELVEGIDYSVNSIAVAEAEFGHPRVRRRVADIFEEPNSEFDLVVSFQVVEHVRDQVGFLAACARQTRAGGHVAVATPNRLRLDNRVRTAMRREPTLVDVSHFRELSRSDLVELARQAALRPVAGFAYGLSLTIPRLNRQIVPRESGIRLGSWLASVATVFVMLFEQGPKA
jgi:2-polyprenyl-3-methyl-5-hydroxy-6-metoxy-1,4-benzoquinol methylase